MATAQTAFAGDVCNGVSGRARVNFGLRYLGIYSFRGNGDYLKPFNEGVDAFKQNYAAAWRSLDAPSKKAFCEAYLADVNFDISRFIVLPTEFYLQFFAPLSQEGLQEREQKLKRAEKLKWLAFAGQLLSVAAQVSAGNDALKAGNAGLERGRSGDLSGMNSAMSESAELFDISRNYFNVGSYFAHSERTVPGEMSSAAFRSYDCNAITHFAMWNAPPTDAVWSSYQSLSTGCQALANLRLTQSE